MGGGGADGISMCMLNVGMNENKNFFTQNKNWRKKGGVVPPRDMPVWNRSKLHNNRSNSLGEKKCIENASMVFINMSYFWWRLIKSCKILSISETWWLCRWLCMVNLRTSNVYIFKQYFI